MELVPDFLSEKGYLVGDGLWKECWSLSGVVAQR